MMNIPTEYDYEPGERVDYVIVVTLIIYYQSLSEKMTPQKFFDYFAVLYCDCAHTSIHIIFSVYATSVV